MVTHFLNYLYTSRMYAAKGSMTLYMSTLREHLCWIGLHNARNLSEMDVPTPFLHLALWPYWPMVKPLEKLQAHNARTKTAIPLQDHRTVRVRTHPQYG